MWRISQGAVAAAGTRRGRAAIFGLLACTVVLLAGLAASSEAAKVGRTTVILGETSTDWTLAAPPRPESSAEAWLESAGATTGAGLGNSARARGACAGRPRRASRISWAV